MYPVSDAFKERIVRSHKAVSYINVHAYTGELLYERLPISGGTVNIDKDSDIRRRLRCTVIDEDTTLTVKDVTDLLHPLSGNEVYPYRGLEFPDGTEEVVPLGIFAVEDYAAEDSGDNLRIEITGFDRSSIIRGNRFIEPYFVAEGTNYADAIRNLVDSRMPGLVYDFMPTDQTTPPMVFGTGGWSGGGDPWEDAQKMAESLGAELFFNQLGQCILQPEPDPATDPVVWDYNADSETGTVLYIRQKLTREGVFNYVAGYAVNSAGDPIRVIAQDDDPNSPTYVNGAFGTVPTFYRTTMILTENQMTDAVNAKLRSVLGTPEKVSFQALTNPAHEVGDIITLSRNRLKMYESRHVLDKITIPLEYNGSMQTEAREKRIYV